MAAAPRRYRSAEEDSARWERFVSRPGDIVISTRSKSGTTWMQMICALLVHQSPDLPAPLARLSPWLDWLVLPEEEVFGSLGAQRHRRVIKTHTPLDGLPLRPGVTYVVVGRHPLDMAVSLYHQSANLDRARIAELTGRPMADRPPQRPLRDWLASWVESDVDPLEQLDSLPGVLWHLTDAWRRRREPNVVLVHYDRLREDLSGEMRRLADLLDVRVREEAWPALVRAATFAEMKARADLLVPDPSGVLRSHGAFFRAGESGAGRALLTDDQRATYTERTSRLAPADLLAWLHREEGA